jgi:hypothetical protein
MFHPDFALAGTAARKKPVRQQVGYGSGSQSINGTSDKKGSADGMPASELEKFGDIDGNRLVRLAVLTEDYLADGVVCQVKERDAPLEQNRGPDRSDTVEFENNREYVSENQARSKSGQEIEGNSHSDSLGDRGWVITRPQEFEVMVPEPAAYLHRVPPGTTFSGLEERSILGSRAVRERRS